MLAFSMLGFLLIVNTNHCSFLQIRHQRPTPDDDDVLNVGESLPHKSQYLEEI
jgi:hypothetical protein